MFLYISDTSGPVKTEDSELTIDKRLTINILSILMENYTLSLFPFLSGDFQPVLFEIEMQYLQRVT